MDAMDGECSESCAPQYRVVPFCVYVRGTNISTSVAKLKERESKVPGTDILQKNSVGVVRGVRREREKKRGGGG